MQAWMSDIIGHVVGIKVAQVNFNSSQHPMTGDYLCSVCFRITKRAHRESWRKRKVFNVLWHLFFFWRKKRSLISRNATLKNRVSPVPKIIQGWVGAGSRRRAFWENNVSEAVLLEAVLCFFSSLSLSPSFFFFLLCFSAAHKTSGRGAQWLQKVYSGKSRGAAHGTPSPPRSSAACQSWDAPRTPPPRACAAFSKRILEPHIDIILAH